MSRIKEFTLPDLGEGLTEGEILSWLVKVGDTIELNQPIVEVETAKAAVEIPAKWAGVVTRIFHEAGATVEVGAPIVAIDTDPSAGPLSPDGAATEVETGRCRPRSLSPRSRSRRPKERSSRASSAARHQGAERRSWWVTARGAPQPNADPRTPSAPSSPGTGSTPPAAAATSQGAAAPASPPVAAPAPPAPEPDGQSGPVLAKPPVRKLARDLGVDLAGIAGTGPMGSVTREDVQQAATQPAATATPAAAVFDASREQRIPVKGVRKLTAENMVASAFTAPHVTEFLTVDATRSMKALDKIKARPEFRDLRVSPLLLVAKAVLLAVRRHPMVNSTWSGDTGEIVVKEYVNLGIAAATERGLIVPNVKDAGRLTLRELAEALNTLVQVAKSGRTPPGGHVRRHSLDHQRGRVRGGHRHADPAAGRVRDPGVRGDQADALGAQGQDQDPSGDHAGALLRPPGHRWRTGLEVPPGHRRVPLRPGGGNALLDLGILKNIRQPFIPAFDR